MRGSCYFTVFGTIDGVEYGYNLSYSFGEGVFVQPNDWYVDLGTVYISPPLTLSGTVTGLDPDTGLVDDNSVESPWRVFVYASNTGSLLGSGEVQSNGAWSASVFPPGSAVSLYFTLGTVLYHENRFGGEAGEHCFQSGLAGSGTTSSPTGIALSMPETSSPLPSTEFGIASPDRCWLFKVLPGEGKTYNIYTVFGNVDMEIYLDSGSDGSKTERSSFSSNLPPYRTQILQFLDGTPYYYVLVRTYATNDTGTFALEVTSS
jgi:hypothetical protein